MKILITITSLIFLIGCTTGNIRYVTIKATDESLLNTNIPHMEATKITGNEVISLIQKELAKQHPNKKQPTFIFWGDKQNDLKKSFIIDDLTVIELIHWLRGLYSWDYVVIDGNVIITQSTPTFAEVKKTVSYQLSKTQQKLLGLVGHSDKMDMSSVINHLNQNGIKIPKTLTWDTKTNTLTITTSKSLHKSIEHLLKYAEKHRDNRVDFL